MRVNGLIDIGRTLVADSKGLLAMDESSPTCNKRFAKLGIPQTGEARRTYRELIVTTPGLGERSSGVILYDETIRQQERDGASFIKVITDAGIIAGVKVDTGAKDMAGHPGEKISEGLDGLRDGCRYGMGLRSLPSSLGFRDLDAGAVRSPELLTCPLQKVSALSPNWRLRDGKREALPGAWKHCFGGVQFVAQRTNRFGSMWRAEGREGHA